VPFSNFSSWAAPSSCWTRALRSITTMKLQD
jgi:hypothetical protein